MPTKSPLATEQWQKPCLPNPQSRFQSWAEIHTFFSFRVVSPWQLISYTLPHLIDISSTQVSEGSWCSRWLVGGFQSVKKTNPRMPLWKGSYLPTNLTSNLHHQLTTSWLPKQNSWGVGPGFSWPQPLSNMEHKDSRPHIWMFKSLVLTRAWSSLEALTLASKYFGRNIVISRTLPHLCNIEWHVDPRP